LSLPPRQNHPTIKNKEGSAELKGATMHWARQAPSPVEPRSGFFLSYKLLTGIEAQFFIPVVAFSDLLANFALADEMENKAVEYNR
ncbi:MAG: hypothetical protein K2K59_03440, partial [Muribaculaceae bacterium]|nr:hypothetical protein [Muribaculaceae bacterium]